jgi:hypothetical protein
MFRRKNRHIAPTNPETIALVPDTHITPERRAALLTRAEAGEDVYAYGSEKSPTQIINLWDTDTRIILFPLASWKWELVTCQPIMLDQATVTRNWKLTFKDRPYSEARTITVHIDRRPDENLETYGQRAQRIASEIEGDINFYGHVPDQYNRTNW